MTKATKKNYKMKNGNYENNMKYDNSLPKGPKRPLTELKVNEDNSEEDNIQVQ